MKFKFLMFAMVAAAFLSSAISGDKSLKEGMKAPVIETVQGINVVADANSENKTKVISFWNPKKPDSRIKTKNLGKLYGGNSDKYDFITICTDPDEKLMKEVMKIDGFKSENFAYTEVNSRVFKDYGVEDSTGAFVISPDGKIKEIL